MKVETILVWKTSQLFLLLLSCFCQTFCYWSVTVQIRMWVRVRCPDVME